MHKTQISENTPLQKLKYIIAQFAFVQFVFCFS